MLRKVNAYCIESEALHFAYLFSIASDFDFVSQLNADFSETFFSNLKKIAPFGRDFIQM